MSENAADVLFRNLANPDRVAVHCGDTTLTYGQHIEAASRLTNALLALGLEPGDRVVLLLLDSPELPQAFFGCMRAGLVPIPVNTVLPPDAYAYFLNDSGAKAIVVSPELVEKVDAVADECPDLRHIVVAGRSGRGHHAWQDLAAAAEPELAEAEASGDSPAFWLYSSGSTGFPKGVVHRHSSLNATVETYARGVLDISADDVMFSASKAFHAYGLGNNLSFPYAVGAASVLYPGRPTPEAAFEHIERFSPTLFFTAPTLYALMLDHAERHDITDLGRVRHCVSAAEALPPDIYRRWVDRFGVEILDGIGSTEMLHIFLSNRPGAVVPGSSGSQVDGYRVRVEDEDGEPVPDGVAGDLLVAGPTNAIEYWNRPEKTAHTMRGEWMFTGDRYRREDGVYFYEGRSDDMIKVSGLWVSPIEVENALLEHPDVLECAVVAHADANSLIKTKAFVVLRDGADDEGMVTALQDAVKGRMAPHAYPRWIEFVDDLPKTATGKIQRFKLRDQ